MGHAVTGSTEYVCDLKRTKITRFSRFVRNIGYLV